MVHNWFLCNSSVFLDDFFPGSFKNYRKFQLLSSKNTNQFYFSTRKDAVVEIKALESPQNAMTHKKYVIVFISPLRI